MELKWNKVFESCFNIFIFNAIHLIIEKLILRLHTEMYCFAL